MSPNLSTPSNASDSRAEGQLQPDLSDFDYRRWLQNFENLSCMLSIYAVVYLIALSTVLNFASAGGSGPETSNFVDEGSIPSSGAKAHTVDPN